MTFRTTLVICLGNLRYTEGNNEYTYTSIGSYNSVEYENEVEPEISLIQISGDGIKGKLWFGRGTGMPRYYSTIYWHFTGSPKGLDWDKITKPADILTQGKPLKSDDEAVEIIRKILKSLKLIAFAKINFSPELSTDPFCCVTDIPIKDLPSHSFYYGKAAIGFRASAIYNRFLPVLYASQNFVPSSKREIVTDAHGLIDALITYHGLTAADLLDQVTGNYNARAIIDTKDFRALKGPYLNYLKMTDFSVAPEDTFYCEREWRKVGDFNFQLSDVAVIVVPEKYLGQMKKYVYEILKSPETVSLIAWELIEQV